MKYAYKWIQGALTAIFIAFILLALQPIFQSGQIIFSDLNVGLFSERYLEEMVGIWNERWSTPTLFNLPRVWFVLPFQQLASVFDLGGAVLLKSMISALLVLSGLMMRLLVGRLFSDLKLPLPYTIQLLVAWFAGLLYALNPWSIVRIQHLYLLVGYAFIPLLLLALWVLFTKTTFQSSMRDTVWYATAIAIAYAMTATSQHYFIFGGILIAFSYGLILIAWLRLGVTQHIHWGVIWRRWLISALITGILSLCLMAYWLLPYLGALVTGTLTSQYNINTNLTVDVFSRYSHLDFTLLGFSYWWPMLPLDNLSTASLLGGGVLLVGLLPLITVQRWRWLILLFGTIAILATGTYYDWLRPFYLYLVFHLPSLLGSIFRDPNKLVGVLMLLFAPMLALGLVSLFLRLSRRWHLALLFIFMIAWGAWITPWYETFINVYYRPPDLPLSYQKVFEILNDQPQHQRVLYLPSTDWMLNPNLGYTTPDWNIFNRDEQQSLYRATSDFMVFSTPMNTLFQNEGASANVAEFYHYIQLLLSWGRAENLQAIFQYAGVDWVVFQSVYSQADKVQSQMLETLYRSELTPIYADETLHLFRVTEQLSRLQTIERVVYTGRGYPFIDEVHSLIPSINVNTAFVHTSQQPLLMSPQVRAQDAIDSATWQDILLSNLPSETYHFPAEWQREETGWQPAKITDRQLNRLFTSAYAPSLLDATTLGQGIVYAYQPYYVVPTEAPLPIWYDSATLNSQFNTPLGNITTTTNELQFTGYSEGSQWVIAESKALLVHGIQGLRLHTILNADNVYNFHLKVLFFDSLGRQIFVQYISPTKLATQFTDEVISDWIPVPEQAQSAYLQVLTQSMSYTRASSWTLRDLRLDDASSQSRPVTTSTDLLVEPKQIYRAFIRLMTGQQGGQIEVSIGDNIHSVDTLTQTRNQFVWVDLGLITPNTDRLTIRLTHNNGFNMVNAVTLVPELAYDDIKQSWQAFRQISQVFSYYNADTHLDYQGNSKILVQDSDAPNGYLTLFANGTLSASLPFFRLGTYHLVAQHAGLHPNQRATFTLFDPMGNIVLSKDLASAEENATSLVTSKIQVTIGEPGLYRLEFRIDSEPAPQTLIFSPQETRTSHLITTGKNHFVLPSSTAQNWQVLTTEPIELMSEQYSLSYKLAFTGLRNPHFKLTYLDSNGDEIKIEYIGNSCHMESEVSLCLADQQILTPPESAHLLQVSMLMQANPNAESSLQINQFEVISLDDYLGLAGILVASDDFMITPLNSPTTSNPSTLADARLDISGLDEQSVILWRESPSPLWQTVGVKEDYRIPLNGVHQGFGIASDGIIRIGTRLDFIYGVGVVISTITLLVIGFGSLCFKR